MLKMSIGEWSLGLYLGSDDMQGVLLQRVLGRVKVHAYWRQEGVAGETELVQFERFLEPILACLTASKKLPSLIVNLGLPHERCAWQSLPTGGLVMWQRQAAMHWQLDPTQVYSDVLPIASRIGLLISTPSQPISILLRLLDVLRPAVTKSLHLCLETDVSALLKFWPWRLRQHLVLSAWQSNVTNVFVDAAGLHVCDDSELPARLAYKLYCGTQHADDGDSWCWQVSPLPKNMMLAWHLAYIPHSWHRPWVAWRSPKPLSPKQYLSLVFGCSAVTSSAKYPVPHE